MAHISSSPRHLSLPFRCPFVVPSSPPHLPLLILCLLQPPSTLAGRQHTHIQKKTTLSLSALADSSFVTGLFVWADVSGLLVFHIRLAYVSPRLVIFRASRADVKHNAG